MTILNTKKKNVKTDEFPTSFSNAELHGILPLRAGKIGISVRTEDNTIHRFVISQSDAELIGQNATTPSVAKVTDHPEAQIHPTQSHLTE